MIQSVNYAWFWAKQKMGSLLKNERGEVNIVATVVLIGIAVLLAIVFKDAIMDLLRTLLNKIKGDSVNAVS